MNCSKGFMGAGVLAVAVGLVMTGLMEGAVLGAETTAVGNLCIAANGAVQVQRGTATCEASGKGSRAVAKGPGSSATAEASHRLSLPETKRATRYTERPRQAGPFSLNRTSSGDVRTRASGWRATYDRALLAIMRACRD